MIRLSSVYRHVHQYLKEDKGVQKDITNFKDRFGVDIFDSVEALVGMSINKDISRKNLNQETKELRETLIKTYKKYSVDFAAAVNKTFDHLKAHYKNSMELTYNGEDKGYRIYDAVVEAEKILGRTKVKEEERTF